MVKLPALLAALSLVPAPRPDATVVTRAMTATTIAEFFVDQDSFRLQIEIGIADLRAFGNLLPNEIREQIGLAPEPLQERLQQFFSEDCVVRADGGDPLIGRVKILLGRRRLVRDEITGEPLPNQPADAEVVVYAELTYSLKSRPATLSLQPPLGSGARASANIGFVLYHEGLPVNDFRYLSAEETVDLDWVTPGTRSSGTRTCGGSTRPRCRPTSTWNPSRFARRSSCGPEIFSSGSISASLGETSSAQKSGVASSRGWSISC